VKPKIIKLIFVTIASRLSMQHLGVRAKTGWLRIRIMCLYGETCLSADCCFSELALKNTTKHGTRYYFHKVLYEIS
jgi:diaminopimelate decarboxylase